MMYLGVVFLFFSFFFTFLVLRVHLSLDMCVYSFHNIWKFLTIIFSKFSPSSSPFEDYSHGYIGLLKVLSHLTDAVLILLGSFFSQWYTLNSFYCCVFKFTNLFFAVSILLIYFSSPASLEVWFGSLHIFRATSSVCICQIVYIYVVRSLCHRLLGVAFYSFLSGMTVNHLLTYVTSQIRKKKVLAKILKLFKCKEICSQRDDTRNP